MESNLCKSTSLSHMSASFLGTAAWTSSLWIQCRCSGAEAGHEEIYGEQNWWVLVSFIWLWVPVSFIWLGRERQPSYWFFWGFRGEGIILLLQAKAKSQVFPLLNPMTWKASWSNNMDRGMGWIGQAKVRLQQVVPGMAKAFLRPQVMFLHTHDIIGETFIKQRNWKKICFT